MAKTEIKQFDHVIVDEGGKDVKGMVESIQLHPLREGQTERAVNKIDVRIGHKGHADHGRIIAVNPSDVHLDPEFEKSASA